MRRCLAVFLIFLVLSGCGSRDPHLQTVTQLREKLLQMQSCSFDAVIYADYADTSYEFSVFCQGDREGNISFKVTEPETIAGISGTIRAQGGVFTFDEAVLGFPLLADGEVSPVSAPWILLRTLLGGYISSCVMEEEYLHVVMDDSYEADALQVDVWLNAQKLPQHAQIVWQGRRVLSLRIDSFIIV